MVRNFPLCDGIVEAFDAAKIRSDDLVLFWYGCSFHFGKWDPEVVFRFGFYLACGAQFLIQVLFQSLIQFLIQLVRVLCWHFFVYGALLCIA